MSAEARSMAIPHRWPLVNVFQTRNPNTPLTKDARLINCYAEMDPEDQQYWIYKRPGLSVTPFLSAGVSIGLGMYTTGGAPSVPLSVQNNIVYSSITNVGTIAGALLPCFFETIPTANPTIFIMNGAVAYLYVPATSSFTAVSDVNYPASLCPGVAYLDGTVYVMDWAGTIWNSANAALQPGNWTPASSIKASAQGDSGVFLTRQLSYVIAMKQWTTQVFYDAGNSPGSPLAPVPDAQIPFGCISPYSVQKIDEILFWMSSNQTISPQIIMMENLQPRIISTPAVDRILDNVAFNFANAASQSGIYSWVFKHAGHRFYGITITYNNITLVYDIDQKLWYVWTDQYGNFWPISAMAYTSPTSNATGLHLAQHVTNGNVYVLDGDYQYPNDYGTQFPVDIYTPNFSAGTSRRKTLNMMYFSADQVPGSVLQARYTDDDYQTWSNFRAIDLSEPRPMLDQEGTFTKRAYHFRHQANTTFRIKSSDLQLDIGTL